MRESEEYLDDNCTYTDSDCWVLHEDASEAVKLAYKEGYLEARADILEELNQPNDGKWLFLDFALSKVRQMKLPENLFK